MGSDEILKVKYRIGFAFIGIYGYKAEKPNEIWSYEKEESVSVTQIFHLPPKYVYAKIKEEMDDNDDVFYNHEYYKQYENSS